MTIEPRHDDRQYSSRLCRCGGSRNHGRRYRCGSLVLRGDAILTPAGQPEASEIRGHDALRTVFASWAGTDPRLTVDTQTVIEAGDIALALGSWTLTMNGPDGQLDLAGTYSDVVRRQSDGGWLYVIDRPTMG